jgi:hypothetical protein
MKVARKDWTVLYYLNGNNDLEPNLVRNLLDVQKVGSQDRVDIVAQLSRAPQETVYGPKSDKKTRLDGDWTGLRRYHIAPGSSRSKILSPPLVQSDVTPNHGQSQSLSDFLSWGMKNFPARHYMVVIGDHGKGFEGTGFDYLHKDVLDLKEFKSALQDSGLKPDILMLDACEMGSVEVAYQLRDSAKILVASEEIIGTMGLPHSQFLQHLADNPKLTPSKLAVDLVNISADDSALRVERGKDQAAEQLAAIDLQAVQPLAKSLQELGQAISESSISRKKLKELIENTQHFNLISDQKPDSDYRDLKHFCQLLVEEGGDERVSRAAKTVEKALQSAILENHCQGEEVTDAHGLSVYLPPHPIQDKPNQVKAPNGSQKVAQSQLRYRDLDFDQASGWSQWLTTRFAKASGSSRAT